VPSELLGELAPLALVVALSPFSVIPPVLLVLHSTRPRATGLTFMLGWIAGLAVSTAVFLQIPRVIGGSGEGSQAWTAWARIGIGAVLLLFGVLRWLTRHRATESPKWLNRLSKVTPAAAAGVGFVLPLVNPKFLVANAAAGLVLGSSDSSVPWLWLAFYTILAASTVVLPILAYVAAPDRLDPALAKIKVWLDRQHAPLTAVILVAIGVVLVYQGIRGL
jgi:threonine/homoserine/homoserine lactone efflux protein